MTSFSMDRKHPRVQADALVWWRRGLESEPLTIRDVSAGGLLCEVPPGFQLGQVLDLLIEFPELGEKLDVQCHVANLRGLGKNLELCGLALQDMDGETQKLWQKGFLLTDA